MFLSSYKRKVTQGGRTAVPEKYCDELSKQFIIALPLSDKPCLTVYTTARFEEIFNTLDERGIPTDALTAYAVPISCDSQWRFTIPMGVRDESGEKPFGDEVIFVGVGAAIEIWRPEDWDNNDIGSVEARTKLGRDYSKIKRKKA